MRAIGLLAGLGSMLYEAQEQGWDVTGNVETRPIYHVMDWWNWNLGSVNFKSVHEATHESYGAAVDMYDADFAMGHPPCGAHSVLGESKVSKDWSREKQEFHRKRRASRVGLLPEFAAEVKEFRPKVFALDNLPKILKTVAPVDWWEKTLPQYRISTIIMENGHYGTVQRRRRLWIFGVRRDVSKRPFIFEPISKRPTGAPRTTLECLKGISWEPWLDDHAWGHVHPRPDAYPLGGFRFGQGRKSHLMEHVSLPPLRYLNVPPKHPWVYEIQKSKRISNKVGWIRIDPVGYSRVLSGFPSAFHPLTGWPLTPRERARLMDWPDAFKLNDKQTEVDRRLFYVLTKVTGRAVPSAFIRYLLPQVKSFLRRR